MHLLITILILFQFKYSYGKFEPFIVGEIGAPIERVPHSIYLSAYCKNSWICGASVLNHKILLTAGHCLAKCYNNDRDYLEILAGIDNLDQRAMIRRVVFWKIHEKFVEKTLMYDIGVFVVRKSLRLGDKVKRVIIPLKFPHVEEALVTGWGSTNDYISLPSMFLRIAKVQMRSRAFCEKDGDEMDDTRFCAGSEDSSRDHPSKGDSGSALFILDFHTQIGIVSCRSLKHYAVVIYTNVTTFHDWISRNAKQLYCMEKIHQNMISDNSMM